MGSGADTKIANHESEGSILRVVAEEFTGTCLIVSVWPKILYEFLIG